MLKRPKGDIWVNYGEGKQTRNRHEQIPERRLQRTFKPNAKARLVFTLVQLKLREKGVKLQEPAFYLDFMPTIEALFADLERAHAVFQEIFTEDPAQKLRAFPARYLTEPEYHQLAVARAELMSEWAARQEPNA